MLLPNRRGPIHGRKCEEPLCSHPPAGLHARVREEQEASGKTLGQYMTWLIRTFYDNQKEETTMSGDKRTVAFQVPGELFEKFKDYLQEKGIKQNAFFLDCIHRALAEAQEERVDAGMPPTRGTWSREGRLPTDATSQSGMQMDVTAGYGRNPQKDCRKDQAGSLPVLEVFSCSSTQTT